MIDEHYPVGTVRAVIDTDLVTPATAQALRTRLRVVAGEGVFDPAGRAVLEAVCDRLVPQSDRAVPIELAAIVEHRLATGFGDGWRYDMMPNDITAMRRGIAAIDDSARAEWGVGYVALGVAARDALLAAVQRGDAAPLIWGNLDPRRFFEELLVAVTEAYYAHPVAQEEIGYLGMADAGGWRDVNLGARAAYEPVAL